MSEIVGRDDRVLEGVGGEEADGALALGMEEDHEDGEAEQYKSEVEKEADSDDEDDEETEENRRLEGGEWRSKSSNPLVLPMEEGGRGSTLAFAQRASSVGRMLRPQSWMSGVT